jgi:hypothetical protein
MQYTSPAISALGTEGLRRDQAEIAGLWVLIDTALAVIVAAAVASVVTVIAFAIDITP